MLNIPTENREHYEAVVAFAKKIGLYDGDNPHTLKNRLDYLDGYAAHKWTRCHLYKDFAPFSFGFTMEVAKRRHRCYSCNEHWTADAKSAVGCCPRCKRDASFSSDVEWTYWFNGGLIFHGSHDGFGSGAAPTLSVTLNPTDGWSIHT